MLIRIIFTIFFLIFKSNCIIPTIKPNIIILSTKYGESYCPQVNLYESIDPDEELHVFNFKRLCLISNDIQAQRIWKKIAKIARLELTYWNDDEDDFMIIEFHINILKSILQEENILPEDMSDMTAIRWLVEHCYGIKFKGKVAI